MFSTFTLVLSVVRVQCPICLFSAVPWCHAVPVSCSRIVWNIFRWFQSPLLLLVSLWLSHSTRAVISIVRSLYFRMFWASFLITFLSPESSASINIHYMFLFFCVIMDYVWYPVSFWDCSAACTYYYNYNYYCYCYYHHHNYHHHHHHHHHPCYHLYAGYL